MKAKLISRIYDKEELTTEQEKEIYETMLQDVIDNPRRFLDNSNDLFEIEFSFISYKKKKAL